MVNAQPKAKICKDAKFLQKECMEVDFSCKDFVDMELPKILDRMRNAMIKGNGIGLAYNQIWGDKKICIVHAPGTNLIEMINPVITSKTGYQLSEEGCLSFPGKLNKVDRAKRIIVQYFDRDGKFKEMRVNKLKAIIIQHEVDHLNGITCMEQ